MKEIEKKRKCLTNFIFYQTRTHYTNTGDALINRTLIEALRQYGVVLASCETGIPTDFINDLGINKDEKLQSGSRVGFLFTILKYAVVSIIKGDRVFVFSGLGDLNAGGFKSVAGNLASSAATALLMALRIRIVRIGRSVGKLSNAFAATERIRSLFCKYYFVRDYQSLDTCHRFGIKADYCPDMSWLYLFEAKKCCNSSNIVIISFRESVYGDKETVFPELVLKKCVRVLACLGQYLRNNVKVRVIYQVQEDRDFCLTLYKSLRNEFNVEFVDQMLRLSDMDRYYGDAAFHISNRLHSILLGYKYGSLPIALIDTEKHKKIAATLTDCELNKLILDINSPDIENSVDSIARNREELFAELLNCEKSNAKKITKTLDEVFA